MNNNTANIIDRTEDLTSDRQLILELEKIADKGGITKDLVYSMRSAKCVGLSDIDYVSFYERIEEIWMED